MSVSETATILGLHHVTLLVADTARSLVFYHQVLGLPLSQRERRLSFPGAWLDLSAAQELHLMELPNPDLVDGRPANPGRDRHFALMVHDLDAFCQRLDEFGQAYQLSASGRRALFMRDPDGNAVELIEV